MRGWSCDASVSDRVDRVDGVVVLSASIVVGVLSGLVRPRTSRYGAPRATLVIVGAAALHLASVPARGTLEVALLIASISVGLVWLALQQRHLPTLLLVIGVLANLVVVVANRGMPVDPAALSSVGREISDVTGSFFGKHVVMDDTTRFAWLGDRIPVPIQRNVVSVGDVVMAIAIVLWIADLVGGARHERRSAGAVDRDHRSSSRRELADGDLA